jgi:ribosomal protein S18 acetylase RimI-like enzyme
MNSEVPLLKTEMTLMEMRFPLLEAMPAPVHPEVYIRPVHQPDVDSYVALYRRVGEPYLWQARLDHPRETIEAIIRAPTTEIYNIYSRKDNKPVGFVELDFSDPDNACIPYIGLVPGMMGSGLGGFMMKNAIQIAANRNPQPSRLHFSTCTFDSPRAVGFYKHMGFTVYRENVPDEFPDPRINRHLYGGSYSPQTAPHIPLGDSYRHPSATYIGPHLWTASLP